MAQQPQAQRRVVVAPRPGWQVADPLPPRHRDDRRDGRPGDRRDPRGWDRHDDRHHDRHDARREGRAEPRDDGRRDAPRSGPGRISDRELAR